MYGIVQLKNLDGVPCIATFQELMSFTAMRRLVQLVRIALNSGGQGTQKSQAQGRLACDLGHLRGLRGANALEGDTGLLLDVGDEALLLAVHQRDRHARAARAARAPAAMDVRLGVLSGAVDVKTGVPLHIVQALCIE